jgi:NADH dehydrogenase
MSSPQTPGPRVTVDSAAARNILVLGGTGFVGRSVCEALARRAGGGRIVVPTRHLAHGAHVQSLPTVELVQADVHDGAALARLMAGCDAVVNLVAILHGNAAAFDHVHVALPRKIAQACAAFGVPRLVHISALGVAADAPSMYLRSKAQGEAALAAQPSLRTTVLRPSVIFGADDQFMRVFARLQALAPVMPLAGSDARFQPVWVEDVARAVVHCLQQPATAGQVFECTGPTVYTLSDLVRLAGRYSGHERPQIPLPTFMGRLQAAVMELLPGQPLMSRDNVASMQVPNIASGLLPGLQALGITPTALEAVAPLYLGDQVGRARLNRWRGMTGR